MKKLLLFLLPLSLWASQAELTTQVQKLQKDFKALQKEVKGHQEDLDERIPIIDSVEKKSILDKLNFSPELLLRFDKFDYVNSGIEGEDTRAYDANGNRTSTQSRDEFSQHYDIASTIRLRINMNMELKNIKFYGRLLYINSSQSNQKLCVLSNNITTGIYGDAFDVDRVYVDYTPNKNGDYPFTFSFGILPTTGGTPMQFAENRKRSSLFPALVFDMNTYGMIATQKIAKTTFIRLIVAKAYTLSPNVYPYHCNRENIDNADIIGLYSDTKLHFLGNTLLSYGLNMMHNLKAHPYLGPNVTSANASNLGTMLTLGLGMDIEDIFQTHTTLFAHTALSNPHANSNVEDYQIKDSNATYEGTGFTESTYATGPMLQHNGYALYLGAKYNFTPTLYLGAEYNYGSKYWFSATQGAQDMYNKLATRGHVGEFYTVWNYHKYLSSKVGYLYTKEQYTGSGWHFGEPRKKDAYQSIFYMQLKANF